ncbi:GAF domain-containing protein [Kitasatospora aburaviensis]
MPADRSGPQPTASARATRPDPRRPRQSDAAARAAHERDALLATAVRNALESTGAYGALVYLRSRDRRSLVLCTIAGVPLSLMSAFRRIAAVGPMPVAVCYRTGRTVTLSDTEDTMRRFPQLAVGLPYDYASACVPVRAGEERYGVVSALWPSSDEGCRRRPGCTCGRWPTGWPPDWRSWRRPGTRSSPTATPRWSSWRPRGRPPPGSGSSTGTWPPGRSPPTTSSARSSASIPPSSTAGRPA